MKTGTLLFLLSLIFYSYCTNKQPESDETINQGINSPTANPEELPQFTPFERDSILVHLKQKSRNNEPLVVHVFVPLCDNLNQGIVPVNATLGDGKNLKTNLYWGARYGVKSFFKYDKTWKLLTSQLDHTPIILERVVFQKTIGTSDIYLVADAYSGDRMKSCLEDFLNTIAQKHHDSIQLPDSNWIQIGSSADLIIFNGHNGLMDTNVEPVINTTSIKKDVAVIGCISYQYFYEYLNFAGGYPLLTTTSLMAPEAYVTSALVEHWAAFESEEEIRRQAAIAYSEYQKCSLKGAMTIFKSGD